jgi:hypothetical protein
LIGAPPATVDAPQNDQPARHQYQGDPGKSRIGMTVLGKGTEISRGRDFYQTAGPGGILVYLDSRAQQPF